MTTIDTGHLCLLLSVTHDGVYRHVPTGHGDFRMPDHDLVDMAPLAAAGLARLDDTTVTTSQGVVSCWTLTGRDVRHVHRYLTAPRPSPGWAPLREAATCVAPYLPLQVADQLATGIQALTGSGAGLREQVLERTVQIVYPHAFVAGWTDATAGIGEAARWRLDRLHNDDEQALWLNAFARAAAQTPPPQNQTRPLHHFGPAQIAARDATFRAARIGVYDPQLVGGLVAGIAHAWRTGRTDASIRAFHAVAQRCRPALPDFPSDARDLEGTFWAFRAAAVAGKVATFQRMPQPSPATVAEAVQAAAGLLHPPGTANRPAAAVESPARLAVHTGRSPQPAPTPPRHSPPAGAPRR